MSQNFKKVRMIEITELEKYSEKKLMFNEYYAWQSTVQTCITNI